MKINLWLDLIVSGRLLTKLASTDVHHSAWSARGSRWTEAVVLWVDGGIGEDVFRWGETVTFDLTVGDHSLLVTEIREKKTIKYT